MAECKHCKQEIKWIILPNGKKLPVEPEKTNVWIKLRDRDSRVGSMPTFHWKKLSGYQRHDCKEKNADSAGD